MARDYSGKSWPDYGRRQVVAAGAVRCTTVHYRGVPVITLSVPQFGHPIRTDCSAALTIAHPLYWFDRAVAIVKQQAHRAIPARALCPPYSAPDPAPAVPRAAPG